VNCDPFLRQIFQTEKMKFAEIPQRLNPLLHPPDPIVRTLHSQVFQKCQQTSLAHNVSAASRESLTRLIKISAHCSIHFHIMYVTVQNNLSFSNVIWITYFLRYEKKLGDCHSTIYNMFRLSITRLLLRT
jgi:hypothetical protein